MAQKAAGRRGSQMRKQIDARRGGPGQPSGKSSGKPSSEHISGRRKTWLSARETVDSRGNDTGKRSGLPWWKSPAVKQERLRKAATRSQAPA
jgi:hypothetical protein